MSVSAVGVALLLSILDAFVSWPLSVCAADIVSLLPVPTSAQLLSVPAENVACVSWKCHYTSETSLPRLLVCWLNVMWILWFFLWICWSISSLPLDGFHWYYMMSFITGKLGGFHPPNIWSPSGHHCTLTTHVSRRSWNLHIPIQPCLSVEPDGTVFHLCVSASWGLQVMSQLVFHYCFLSCHRYQMVLLSYVSPQSCFPSCHHYSSLMFMNALVFLGKNQHHIGPIRILPEGPGPFTSGGSWTSRAL